MYNPKEPLMQTTVSLSEDLQQRLVALRHDIHRHPEVSGREAQTARRVREFLNEFAKPDALLTKLGGHGLLAVYEGKEKGETLMFRSELDALPIQEVNTFPHRSVFKEVGHKCGHDGHTAMLCALAVKLSHKRPSRGRVLLLFQPSEEDGRGAQSVLREARFRAYKPDFVFALHNIPGEPLGQVITRAGSFTPAVRSIIVKFHGKTSHAAEPEMGFNPAESVARYTLSLLEAQEPDLEHPDFTLVTPIFTKMGSKAYGTSAGHGEAHFTLRSWTNEQMLKFSEFAEEKARELATKFNLKTDISWTEEFFANQNAKSAVEQVREATAQLGYAAIERPHPFKWGEDFGLFTHEYPGCMFGLGSGKDVPALHNPDYDFPDELIKVGSSLFEQILRARLG